MSARLTTATIALLALGASLAHAQPFTGSAGNI